VVDSAATLQFLRTAYEPDDWVAVFLKSFESGRVAQRIAPLSVVMSPRFQGWLVRENETTVNVYVSANAIRPRTVSRRRTAIGTVRHVFLDADKDGNAVLGAIAARRDLPSPSYVLHSSPNRIHVFWRVTSFTVEHVEALQKQLARDLDTDPAATSCSQTTRLPGFLNYKRNPPSPITVEYRCIQTRYSPADFPLPEATVRSDGGSFRPVRTKNRDLAVLERARCYVATVPPAVTGQHGDVHTFQLCCRLVRGFALSDHEALELLIAWNVRCEPPWSERELTDKLLRARKYGREPIGGLMTGLS
jgi:hypothetical protein